MMFRLYYYGADCPELREWITRLQPGIQDLCLLLLQEAQSNLEAHSEYLWAVNEILHMEKAKPFVDHSRILEWFGRCFDTTVLMRDWVIENAISEGVDRAEAERLQALQVFHQQRILSLVKK